MTTMQRIIVTGTTVLALSAIFGCTKAPIAYDFGPTSATGTLIPTEVSLIRRGSHALVVEGNTKYYVESRTQNLGEYEGRTVFISGTLEPNTNNADLPVLLAEHIVGPRENEDLRRFEVPRLQLRLGIPESWRGSLKDGVAHFSLNNDTVPLLTVRQLSGTSLPLGESTFFIKNRRTTRTNGADGSQEVYILDKDVVVHLHFDPQIQEEDTSAEEREILIAQFERVLSTISFLSDREAPKTGTGSISEGVCGGEAGQLCGTGYFCNITDAVNRIGVCKKR